MGKVIHSDIVYSLQSVYVKPCFHKPNQTVTKTGIGVKILSEQYDNMFQMEYKWMPFT